MSNRIVIFKGSKKDFEYMINEEICEFDETITFMELIQLYNSRLRPNESGVREDEIRQSVQADNCIVRADDYGSVLAHVLNNFANVITLNHDVDCFFIHNPPRKVEESLLSRFGENVEYKESEYESITIESLKQVFLRLKTDVLGQREGKQQIISSLYKAIRKTVDKPVVIMLYGPSGVGKTESAKCISESLGGKLLRIQFSMMQSAEAYNYIFGSEHSKSCFARDMLCRETNVVLIDEFDKVSDVFYNAFYELFDDGKYVDVNYDVYLGQTIFILTSNFKNENEIMEKLGPAMFSRIGACIEYKDLSVRDKEIIINKWYDDLCDSLTTEEQKAINDTNILSWFKENAGRYDNIRLLKNKLENAIFDILAQKFIMS